MWSLGVIIYILLAGYHPFRKGVHEDERPIERKICDGKYTFHDRYWKNVSVDAKDLIKKVLVVNPKERLTAIKALQHPWFTRNDHVTESELLTDNLQQLKIFNIKRKLRAAVFTVFAINKFTTLGIYPNSMMTGNTKRPKTEL
jgi:serine/threonine protein kinase